MNFPMENTIKRNLKDNANNVSVINFLRTSYPLAKNHYLLALLQFVDSVLASTRENLSNWISPQQIWMNILFGIIWKKISRNFYTKSVTKNINLPNLAPMTNGLFVGSEDEMFFSTR